jgi:chromate reductase
MPSEVKPVRILGVSGSLRRGSFSTSLIRLLAKHLSPRCTLTLADISDVPLYNGDLDGDEEACSSDCIQ